jgi:hypothetical protein
MNFFGFFDKKSNILKKDPKIIEAYQAMHYENLKLDSRVQKRHSGF